MILPKRSKAIGLWAGVGGIAAALGPILGAVLIVSFSWRAIFYINLPVGLGALYLGYVYTKGKIIRDADAFDFLGQFFSLISIGALTFSLIEVGRLGLHSVIVLVGIVIFVVGLVAFIVTENNVTSPMFPLPYLRKTDFTVPLCLGIVINVSTFGLLFALPLYFQNTKHFSVLMTGFAILPLFILTAIFSYLSGRCAHHIGEKTIIFIGLLIGILGYLGLLWAINLADSYYIWMIVPLCFIGFSVAFVVPAATMMIIKAVEKK